MQDNDIPREFRARVEAYRREVLRPALLRYRHAKEFPRLANPAHTRLQMLIKRRKELGQWPPSGDEVDTDQELMEVLEDVRVESFQNTIEGPLFDLVVDLQKAREATKKVLARCEVKRARDLEVRRRLLHERMLKRGI